MLLLLPCICIYTQPLSWLWYIEILFHFPGKKFVLKNHVSLLYIILFTTKAMNIMNYKNIQNAFKVPKLRQKCTLNFKINAENAKF